MLESRLLASSEQAPATVQAPPPLPSAIGVFLDQGVVADPARTLLGDAQEAWLAQQLTGSTATWKLLGQQVMFGQLKVLGTPNALGTSLYLNTDQWDGYPRARERVYAMIDGSAGPAVDNVVVLTGDIHTSWAMDITPDPNNVAAYNPLTGDGSIAVEFVATSITSPGLEELGQVDDAIRVSNPHIKYVDLAHKGYLHHARAYRRRALVRGHDHRGEHGRDLRRRVPGGRGQQSPERRESDRAAREPAAVRAVTRRAGRYAMQPDVSPHRM
jgi:alkaline phosphatase D